MTAEEKTLMLICPQCGREVLPVKRPSIAGVWFLNWAYLLYYYSIKKPECIYCGYQFSKKELEQQ